MKSKSRNKTNISSRLIKLGILILVFSLFPLIKDEVWYYIKQLKDQVYSVKDSSDQVEDSLFARYLSSKNVKIDPVNMDFALVIEKIGVNVPIVANVSVTDEKAYINALRSGVAHSFNSDYPSKEPGNVYLFAHASLNFWSLGRYATAFNLLRKLEAGDKIYVFYKGDAYVYQTIGKEVFKGWNTYPLTRTVIQPVLTLQTCDPPGTTLNRLVVTAKLIEVKERGVAL